MFRIIKRALYWLFHNPWLFLDNVVCYLPWLFSDSMFLRIRYRCMVGYPLDLDNPKTFSEKLQWLKLNDIHDEYTQMVDKVEAKKYVAGIIGQEYIIPTLGVWNSVDEIDWDALPNQFVVKPTNDSGGLVICRDRTVFDIEAAKAKLRSLGQRDYSRVSKEYPYRNVPHRFIAEEYKEDESGELRDYKFFCFNGVPRYCQVISGRGSDTTTSFYDRDWVMQEFSGLHIHNLDKTSVGRPMGYEEMLTLAERLAKGIPFVRIDLYNINGKIFFGEITFFPYSGLGEFRPLKWNKIIGDLVVLPNKQTC